MTTTYHLLSGGDLNQNWSNTGLINANGDWSNVPSIMGFRGDDLTTGIGIDPRTITTTSNVVDVIANQANPNTLISGGVAEFQIADPVVALQGSGTADAPYLAFYLNAAGRQNITVEFDVRDIDGSTDNTNQQVAVQYRTSETGAWVNVPGGYIADASTGPSLATLVTHMAVTLPADANNATTLQVRVMTTNAAGNDEWVGIDNIHITSNTAPVADQPGAFSVSDATVVEGNAGTTPITFTVSRGSDSNVAASVHYTVTLPGGASGASASDFVAPVLSGDLAFAANEFTKTVTLQVAGDIVNEADETFTVTLSAPTGGAGIADGSGLGTILNDDAAPAPGTPFINEIHYDNTGNDAGEAIEIAGPAGTSLAGWSLVLYNGNGGAAYATVALGGVITNQDDGYGTVSVPTPGIQNGAPDGVALVDAQGHVVQFLSYEGVMVATSGPANGMTSTDIGVAEEPVPAAGFSLQLQGSGANYADFTWKAVPAADSFGHVNSGQDFIGANATGLIRVADTSVVEGDDNSHQLIFTVTRAGGLSGSGTVDYTLDVGSGAQDAASLNDIAPGTPLSGTLSFAPGESSKQVVITIAGDTVGEANERIGITLSHPTGQVAIQQGQAIGTIVNDDPIALAIYQIQGEGHRSAYVGQTVITNGIVTAVDTNGFYLQDAQGDGNARTSDAVFVFTGTAPAVSVGDALSVVGKVNEFLPSADAANLTVTEIDDATFTLVSSGNPLPAALVIGAGGLLPPSEVIDDDHLTSYDPAHDGIDFYESIEGMRVTVQTPLVVGTTNGFGETWVVASGGVGATGVSARGGITLSDGDLNPERIQLQSDSGLFAGYTPSHTEGDRLGDVTGIVSYSHGSYEVLVTGPVAVTDDVTLQPEVTGLDGDRNHLSVATYNLENIDPTDPQAKFDILAGNIVYNLSAPDILAVQEIQDADGPGGGTNLSGTVTAQKLIDAIKAIGGPDYVYIEIAPTASGSTGGEPGGNIRSGFLYNADRVSFVAGSMELVPGAAFSGSRSPLAATFTFNGQNVTLINVHFTSRGGSDPLFGATQPAADAGDGARTAQGQAVRAYVNDHLATDPAMKIAVLGDFNGFWFEGGVGALEAGGVMTDLHRLLPKEERYSYFFDGNLQAIDHVVVTGSLLAGAQYDPVHINAEQPFGTFRGTDHDPQLATFFIQHPNEAPHDLLLGGAAVDENKPAGTLVGTASASDPDSDTLVYSLTDNAGGRFAIDAATGQVTTTAAFDHETTPGYSITVRATDPAGLYVEKAFAIAVNDVNEAPHDLVLGGTAVDENRPAGTVVGSAAAADPELDTLAYSLTDNAGGRFAIDSATGQVTTTAAFDHETAPGYSITVRATDPAGLYVEKAFAIAVNDVNEAPHDLVLGGTAVDENRPAGTVVGTAAAADPESDTLAYSLTDTAGGRFAIDAATGQVTTTAAFDHETTPGYSITVRATDPAGLYVEKAFAIAVNDVNEAPTAVNDAVAVNEDSTSANLWTSLLGNDSDPDAGTTLSIVGVDTSGTLGTVIFDPATHSLRYVADNDAFDVAGGVTVPDHFTYTVSDGHGLTSTATVNVTVTGINDTTSTTLGNGDDTFNATGGEDNVAGGNGKDVIHGLAGHDILSGDNGDDILFGDDGNDILAGGNGNDSLYGGNGNDRLVGDKGNDVLSGGAGNDVFVFDKSGGNDTVLDFDTAHDTIYLGAGVSLGSSRVSDVDHDGRLDLTLAFDKGGTAVLLGVSDLGAVHFETQGTADMTHPNGFLP